MVGCLDRTINFTFQDTKTIAGKYMVDTKIEMIQNSVVILSAYLTFIISQYYLGVSGVIALLVFGLTVTYVGKPRLKPQVNSFMEHFWELLTYIADTLIFILVGINTGNKPDDNTCQEES